MSATTVTGTDKQDNYFSATAGGFGLYEGSDHETAATGFPADLTFLPPNPETVDAVLKICDVFGPAKLIGVFVSQGHEDSVNFQNGAHDIVITGDISVAGAPGLRCITDKGDCQNITYGLPGRPLVIHQHGTECDIDLGNWSDQNYGTTPARDLTNVAMADGSKVRVRLGHAVWPKHGSNVEIVAGETIEEKIYFWFKRAIRFFARIPVGTSGPKWLA